MTPTIRTCVLCLMFLSLSSLVFAEKNDKDKQVKVNEREDVYTAGKDRKYHKLTCPLLDGKNGKKMSQKEALDKGFIPCPECFKENYPTVIKN